MIVKKETETAKSYHFLKSLSKRQASNSFHELSVISVIWRVAKRELYGIV